MEVWLLQFSEACSDSEQVLGVYAEESRAMEDARKKAREIDAICEEVLWVFSDPERRPAYKFEVGITGKGHRTWLIEHHRISVRPFPLIGMEESLDSH